jgi:hypothetical protein
MPSATPNSCVVSEIADAAPARSAGAALTSRSTPSDDTGIRPAKTTASPVTTTASPDVPPA